MKVEILTDCRLDYLIRALNFALTHSTIIYDFNGGIKLLIYVLNSIDHSEMVRTNKEGYLINKVVFIMDKNDDNIIDLVTSGLKYKIIK